MDGSSSVALRPGATTSVPEVTIKGWPGPAYLSATGSTAGPRCIGTMLLIFTASLEKGSAAARYHGVADEGVPTREIAEVIGRHLNVPVVSKFREEAADHFGWIALFFGIDGPTSSAQTRKQLGSRPVQPGLIADLNAEHYFEPTAEAVPLHG